MIDEARTERALKLLTKAGVPPYRVIILTAAPHQAKLTYKDRLDLIQMAKVARALGTVSVRVDAHKWNEPTSIELIADIPHLTSDDIKPSIVDSLIDRAERFWRD